MQMVLVLFIVFSSAFIFRVFLTLTGRHNLLVVWSLLKTEGFTCFSGVSLSIKYK